MPAPLNRRNFFGSAAAMSLSAAGYGNVVGANERIGIAFLGCGGRAQAHIDLIQRFIQNGQPLAIRAACDVWDGLADEYDVEFGGKVARRRYSQGLLPSATRCGLDSKDRTRVTKDYRRVLDLKDVDAVCIATPDHWHGRMALDAFAAGKDCFIEPPFTRAADEAQLVVEAWKKSGRVATVGVQSLADPVWVAAFDAIRTGKIGPISLGQTGTFRNDIRGQWRYYRLVHEMTPRSVDWNLFLGHQFEIAGRPLGPNPKEQPFDRAAFAQWRCLAPFSSGPLSDMLTHNITRLLAAMGVRDAEAVVGAGSLAIELDGRTVPDNVSVIATFEEGCTLLATASTTSNFPMEETIRGRFGAIKFVKGGFQVFQDDPGRGTSLPARAERPLEPTEFVAVEPPKNETESLWENFLSCVRSRKHATFCPPDLAACAVRITSRAESQLKIKPRPPRPILGWTGGDRGTVLNPPAYQCLAGPWTGGTDPA
ncbi:MAG: Gfo/Idh/MocA family oxidoreductase [Gemmataceae bacterium]